MRHTLVGCLAGLWLFLGVWPVQARLPTEADYTTLASAITTDPALTTMVTERRWGDIAAYYNANAVPDFWVWRTSVPASEYTGANGIVWTEVGALTATQARIFEWLTGQLTLPINASDINVRQGIADTFGAGTTTRANLLVLGRRLATRGEAMFTTGTGTGTTANPAITRLTTAITEQDICYSLGQCPLS